MMKMVPLVKTKKLFVTTLMTQQKTFSKKLKEKRFLKQNNKEMLEGSEKCKKYQK